MFIAIASYLRLVVFNFFFSVCFMNLCLCVCVTHSHDFRFCLFVSGQVFPDKMLHIRETPIVVTFFQILIQTVVNGHPLIKR